MDTTTPAGPYPYKDEYLLWPLPEGGYIASYYGDTGPSGKPEYCIKIAIANGTPIYAAYDGTMIKAEWHSSYGNYVIIDHGSKLSTLYAHCSELCVKAGDKVTKGQVIARVGSTGFSTGYHLHFEVRKNNVKVNPLDYIDKIPTA